MRRRARTDHNHQEIVEAFRRLGCSVISLASVGNGVPDLLCGFQGVTFLCEVKDGKKSPSRQVLTKDEQTFFDTWRGGIATIIRSVDEAIALVQRIVKEKTLRVAEGFFVEQRP